MPTVLKNGAWYGYPQNFLRSKISFPSLPFPSLHLSNKISYAPKFTIQVSEPISQQNFIYLFREIPNIASTSPYHFQWIPCGPQSIFLAFTRFFWGSNRDSKCVNHNTFSRCKVTPNMLSSLRGRRFFGSSCLYTLIKERKGFIWDGLSCMGRFKR